jgi:curved DNA-binding protein CbpA
MQFIDYYSALGIPDLASQQEIKIAYRAMVKKYHPDINHSTDTTERMQLINEAYLILSDLQAKELYDIERKRFSQFNSSSNYNEQASEHAHSGKNKGPQYAERQEADREFQFESEALNDWIHKARQQAKDITDQAIKDAGGIIKEAGNGLLNGLWQLILYVIIINVIVLLVKGCH